jgi:hypothetical protein
MVCNPSAWSTILSSLCLCQALSQSPGYVSSYSGSYNFTTDALSTGAFGAVPQTTRDASRFRTSLSSPITSSFNLPLSTSYSFGISHQRRQTCRQYSCFRLSAGQSKSWRRYRNSSNVRLRLSSTGLTSSYFRRDWCIRTPQTTASLLLGSCW